MLQLFLSFVLIALSVGQYGRPLVNHPYPKHFYNFNPFTASYGQNIQSLKLCTYNEISYKKCLHAIEVARNNSIPLALKCVQEENRESCINSVDRRISDIVVLTGHGYTEARSASLRPLIFAKEDDQSLYVAVAPRNITFIEVQEAPIYFDHSNHRAFHAAIFFNLRMGHDICSFRNKASLTSYISIVDSTKYVPSSEEILICPDRRPNEFENYKQCNIEAGLQRAAFVRSDISWEQEQAARKIFKTIKKRFGANSENFKFFDTFQGQDDVIFKKNTISFDFVPTYRNGLDENVFNKLHCNDGDQPHDPRALL